MNIDSQWQLSTAASDGTLDAGLNRRIASAGIAWHQMKSGKVWSSKYVTLARKVLIFRSVVLTILLYGCETWPALDSHIQRLEVFQMNCLRFLCGSLGGTTSQMRLCDILATCYLLLVRSGSGVSGG